MTSHELAQKLLAEVDAPVQAYDPDSGKFEEVTGYDTGFGTVRLYTDGNT